MDREYTQKKRSSLRELAYVFFRRKWVIIGVFLATVIPVTVYTFRIPPSYVARSRLLIKPGRENIYVSPVGHPAGTHPPTIVQRVAQIITSEIEILKSRVLVRRAVEQIGIPSLFPRMLPEGSVVADAKASARVEVAVNRALASLSARRMRDADIIEVAFKSDDPDVSANFLTVLIDRYLERHLEVHQSGQSYDFFRAQSAQLEQKLQSSARSLADFKKKYNLVSFDERKASILSQYMKIDASIKNNDAASKVTQKKLEELKENLKKVSEHRYQSQAENTDSPVISSLKLKLGELELKRLDLENKYKADHRVAEIDEAMAKVKKMLTEEEERFHGSVTTAASSSYRKMEDSIMELEVDLKALQTKRVELERQLIEYSRELERLGRLEPELEALNRDVWVDEQNYRLYITKFEESRVSDAMDAARMVSVSVIEPPEAPLGPVPVKRALNILVSMCIAGVAGLGLAFLIEYFDHTFKIPEDIKYNLKMPLLGTIEDVPDKEREDLEVLATAPKPSPSYQMLKSNIIRPAEEKGIKTLSICSPTPKEGSSTVALNLAASLAKENGRRVVLVDANLRHPSLHSNLNVPVSPGFSDVIHEDANLHEAIMQSVIANLSVLTSGSSSPNPMVVLESPKLDNLIGALKREFDWIVFDCAPVNMYPDSAVLAARLDRVVLVVQAENKRAEVAIQAKEHLEGAGAKIMGAVLNRRRYIIPEIIYRRL